jgi:hypothetical protein
MDRSLTVAAALLAFRAGAPAAGTIGERSTTAPTAPIRSIA